MEIKIHDIGGYIVKNYLLETPIGIVAIDTGYPGSMNAFRKRFEKLWPLSELKYIFLTHHHDDHAGFLSDLIAKSNAQVVLHPLAAEPIKAGKSYVPSEGGYSSVPASLFGRLKKDFSFPSVHLGNRAIFVHDETEQVFENMGIPIRILLLPGHTADSIGLFLPESGQLFCGDAAMNAIISVARHTIWIDNVENFGKSWDKMIALAPKKIYPSHGLPFSPKSLVKYRSFMEARKLIHIK